jgi:hypothetical protein
MGHWPGAPNSALLAFGGSSGRCVFCNLACYVAFLVYSLRVAVSFAGVKVYGLSADRAETGQGARIGHDTGSLAGLQRIASPFGALLGLVFGDYPAVTERIGARQSSSEFTFLPRLGTTGRATDGERFFWAVFFFDHGGENTILISSAVNGQF